MTTKYEAEWAELTAAQIEAGASAMFECRTGFVNSRPNTRWTWEMCDETTKQYWRDVARAGLIAALNPPRPASGGSDDTDTQTAWRIERLEAENQRLRGALNQIYGQEP